MLSPAGSELAPGQQPQSPPAGVPLEAVTGVGGLTQERFPSPPPSCPMSCTARAEALACSGVAPQNGNRVHRAWSIPWSHQHTEGLGAHWLHPPAFFASLTFPF